MKHNSHLSRRQFLRTSLAGVAGVLIVPTIIPSSVLGADAPSNKIQIGQIGCGRIAHDMDMPGLLKHDRARIVAVCDLDSKRLQHAKAYVEGAYAKKKGGSNAVAVKAYGDYRELLKDGHVDAVAISTPDHWHSEPVIAAALAGKDIYVQKPLSMTLAEGRAVSDILRARKCAFQIGSQQRSTSQFRIACELVRNGRIGKLQTIQIGLPVDPSGEEEPEMPVPANLNYERWLGCTPKVPYTEKRVHPQNSISDRPGWLRIDSYCLGMITGWGSHHVDIAHWGMGTELTGPITRAALSTGGRAESKFLSLGDHAFEPILNKEVCDEWRMALNPNADSSTRAALSTCERARKRCLSVEQSRTAGAVCAL